MGIRIKLRPATLDDLASMGRQSSDETVRAIAATHKERVLGVAGLSFGTYITAFSHISEEMRKYPAAIMRAGIVLRRMIEQQTRPVYAAAQDGILSSETFLLRIGGTYSHELDGLPIYEWLPENKD